MGTIGDKLTYLEETKTAIKNAITEKGVEVSEGIEFREYAEKIKEIQGGGLNIKEYVVHPDSSLNIIPISFDITSGVWKLTLTGTENQDGTEIYPDMGIMGIYCNEPNDHIQFILLFTTSPTIICESGSLENAGAILTPEGIVLPAGYNFFDLDYSLLVIE